MLGVTQIVALRGDPPTGAGTPYQPHVDGYQRTADLVRSIKQRSGFEVAVSAYPERHPQSPTDDHDLDVLAEKCDAGADKAITQMFFDNAHYFRFRDRARRTWRRRPDRAGHLSDPFVSRGGQVRRSLRCLDPGRDSPSGSRDSTTTSRRPTRSQRKSQPSRSTSSQPNGVDEVHLYTLNRADLAVAVCRATWRAIEDRGGMTAATALRAAAAERVLVLDGATGTEFQSLQDHRGRPARRLASATTRARSPGITTCWC